VFREWQEVSKCDNLKGSDRKFVNLGSKFRELLEGDFFIMTS
jgi:hypothetical protein